MNLTNKPLRVAQMMTDMNYGGVEMVVMNYYRHIDHSKVQFDFFALEGSVIPMKKEIEELGGKIYILPQYKNIISYEKEIIKLFKENKYQIVHSHMNTLSVFSMFAAKRADVPIRIAHNHSTAGKGETKKNIMKYALRPFAKIYPTHLAACSRYAGEWLFGKSADFKVFNNAVDTSKFQFNMEIRKELRKELNLENKFVVGHIGRFCYQKNHEFLIDIFNSVLKEKPNATLLLIGEGELLEETKSKVKILGIENSVIFAGSVNDAYKYYQAMDVFVLPSRYEGLGIVAIEAQFAGLPIIAATTVPQEAKLCNDFIYLSLNDSVLKWSKVILSVQDNMRKDSMEIIKNSGFDIKVEAEKLNEWYESIIKIK